MAQQCANQSLTAPASTHPRAVETSRPKSALGRLFEVGEQHHARKARASTHVLRADSTFQGWDEGVMEMSLGETSILTISG